MPIAPILTFPSQTSPLSPTVCLHGHVAPQIQHVGPEGAHDLHPSGPCLLSQCVVLSSLILRPADGFETLPPSSASSGAQYISKPVFYLFGPPTSLHPGCPPRPVYHLFLPGPPPSSPRPRLSPAATTMTCGKGKSHQAAWMLKTFPRPTAGCSRKPILCPPLSPSLTRASPGALCSPLPHSLGTQPTLLVRTLQPMGHLARATLPFSCFPEPCPFGV